MNIVSLVGHVLELIEHADRGTQPLDRLVADFFRHRTYLGSHDRRFIAETLYGIVRHRRLLEALLEQYVSTRPDHAELDAIRLRYLPLYVIHSLHPDVGNIFSEKIPSSYWKAYFPNIDLDPFVEWMRGHFSLDFLDGEETVRLGVRYSFQDWMVEEWIEEVGSETAQLLQALNEQAQVALRTNVLKTTRAELQSRLAMEGIETEAAKYSPTGLIAKKRFNTQASPAFKEGWFEVQDEGSQLVAPLAAPRPGQTVIDACAGAGGKSLLMAEMMHNEGALIAIDIDGRRLQELETRAHRAGINNIRTQTQGETIPENLFEAADVVLVDAPCTGVGTIRRNPMFKWRVTESLVRHYAEKQCAILSSNAQFVKPGGRLVYATCSLFRKENDDVVRTFLSNHSHFAVRPPVAILESIGLSKDGEFVKLYPHRHGTDGFFIAVMERISS